jgi:SAM-dependent methyltransferase
MSEEISLQIREFYDSYHMKRHREPPSWMDASYWKLFEGKTLEVGPGTLYPGRKDLVAVEYSWVASKILAEKGVNVVNGDGQSLPFRDLSFDTVACHDVLEHVPDPKELLAEMARVSRTKVVIVGPNYVGPHRKKSGRLQPMHYRFLSCLIGQNKRIYRLGSPRLVFDENWESDADAVVGVNVWWVVHQLRKHGFKKIVWRTEGGVDNSRWLKWVPFYDLLGFMMFVEALRD